MITNNIVLEGARLGFKNFSGKKGEYNPEGSRNFAVFFNPEDAKDLEEAGWNIKWLKPKNSEEDEELPMLSVAVRFDPYPPKIVLITSRGKTTLSEENVNILDGAEIKNVDLIIRPYNWERKGSTGVKAYLKSMYVTLVEDEFESKYYDVPDSAISAIVGR